MTNTFIGNIGSIDLKFTPGGKAVCEISVAENHSKKDQQGNWQDDGTTWRRVTLWEDKAEAAANFLKKGDRIIVVGRERLREWEGKDGTKGKTLEVQAQVVAKVPPKLENTSTPPPANKGWQYGDGAQQDPWQGTQGQADWGTPPADPPF